MAFINLSFIHNPIHLKRLQHGFMSLLLLCYMPFAQADESKANAEASLFERIGGIQVLTQVVDETVEESANNPKTQRSFKDIKLKTLKKSIVDHLCHITGGHCVYEGESMKKAHADAKISTAEFEVFVEIFRTALNRHVGTREKNELLKLLAPMKRDIVSQ